MDINKCGNFIWRF